MQALELFRDGYQIRDKDTLQKLCAMAELKRCKKGEIYLHRGERQKHILLLWSGIVRGYYEDVDGSEHTDCFCSRRGMPAMPPCGLEEPSPISLMAVTDSEFVALPIRETMELAESSREVMHLYTGFLTESMRLHNRIKNTLCNYTAKQKFDWFLQEYPGLIFDINNRYIASFLNMTPETLSRLRAAGRRRRTGQPAAQEKRE